MGKAQSHVLVQLHHTLNLLLDSPLPDESLAAERLMNPEISPGDYQSASSFRDAYLIAELLSKYPFKVKGVDRKAEALRKFQSAEAQCSLTNATVEVDTVDHVSGIHWHAVIETARLKISHLLNPGGQEFSWDRVEVHCGVGPGATTSLPRLRSDAFYKFGNKPDVTEDCSLLGWLAVYRQPVWFETLAGFRPTGDWAVDYLAAPPEVLFRLVPGNQVTTVPKNAKTDRVIAIEPDLNMYLQKGLGGLIRRRLRSVGIDLNDQSINQRLARKGSLDDSLATVDFSSASDTISIGIVEALLPRDWCCALKQVRSPVGTLPDGSIIQYEKFSSMGNGYTFELESLIFWALARSVCDLLGVKDIVAVYGDDLIVSNSPQVEHALKWAFSRAGFTLNEKKSHWRGAFRESCGKHYFHGDDVTPFYIRKVLRTIWDVYSLANNIRRWARLGYGLDSRVRPVHDLIVDVIPRSYRYLIPDGMGDVGLIADWDEARPWFDRASFNMRCKAFRPVSRNRSVTGSPLLTKWFHMAEKGNTDVEVRVEELPRVVFTDGVEFPLLVSQWPTFGPWL
jgi:hypothetical protein